TVFLYNDPVTTDIYTLSLHDALPILPRQNWTHRGKARPKCPEDQAAIVHLRQSDTCSVQGAGSGLSSRSGHRAASHFLPWPNHRSEEHTSELQSLTNLVCRLLLEKKK